jgi:AcrR family transcriptional regulator
METRERILCASHELLYKFGVRSVTMDDIAKQIGISKKTIYTCFSDKNELVTQFMEEKLGEHLSCFENITANSANAIDEIVKNMEEMGHIFSQMNPNFIYDIQKHHPAAWQLFKDFKNKHIAGIIERNLKQGISEGLYRSDINIKVISKLRLETIEIAFNPLIFPPETYSVRDVQLQLLDHFLHGITTLKGHRLINKYKQLTDEE